MYKNCFFALVAICTVSPTGCAPVVKGITKTPILKKFFGLADDVARPVNKKNGAQIGVMAIRIAITQKDKLLEAIEEARQITEKVSELISNLPQNKSRAFIEAKSNRNTAELNNKINTIDRIINSEQACKQTRERIEQMTQENYAIARLIEKMG